MPLTPTSRFWTAPTVYLALINIAIAIHIYTHELTSEAIILFASACSMIALELRYQLSTKQSTTSSPTP
jgi:hypothetical protein